MTHILRGANIDPVLLLGTILPLTTQYSTDERISELTFV